jgi:membrane-bound ClpP family serine protease
LVRVGDRARVVSTLRPQGFVEVDGKRYDARSEFGAIETGQEVVVVKGDLQGLVVRKVNPGAEDRQLPDHGRPVHSSFGELLDHQERQDESEREAWRTRQPRWRGARLAYGMTRGGLLGLLFSAGWLAVEWEELRRASDDPPLSAAAVIVAGILWAIAVFLTLHLFLQRQLAGVLPRIHGRTYDRLVLLSTALALVGTTGGVLLGVHGPGTVTAAFITPAATLALGSIVPLLIAVNVAPEEE